MWYGRQRHHKIWYGDGHAGARERPMGMTTRGDENRDWTYRAARQRMVRVARTQVSRHAAIPQLDARGNRVVKCGCGWRGNALGWADHLDAVVRSALDAEPAR
jgi:hypothetical protein